jgi:transcriptional pleiotropic regulator of transition state genes
MKSTGIVRKVDELGRIVIPKELRRNLSIDRKDPVEVFVEGDKIILRKYNTRCSLCGSEEQLEKVLDVDICKKCIDDIQIL